MTPEFNIYVVNTISNPSAGGYAYFPYSGYGGTNYRGGVVMGRNNSSVGTHTLAHETNDRGKTEEMSKMVRLE